MVHTTTVAVIAVLDRASRHFFSSSFLLLAQNFPGSAQRFVLILSRPWALPMASVFPPKPLHVQPQRCLSSPAASSPSSGANNPFGEKQAFFHHLNSSLLAAATPPPSPSTHRRPRARCHCHRSAEGQAAEGVRRVHVAQGEVRRGAAVLRPVYRAPR